MENFSGRCDVPPSLSTSRTKVFISSVLGVLVTVFSQLSPFPQTFHSWKKTPLPQITSPFLGQPVSSNDNQGVWVSGVSEVWGWLE